MMMKKSEAYERLLRQINAEGADKLDGYSADMLDNIYESERAEVEQLIWNTFYDKKDIDIAVLFPALETYDGIKALKNKVKEYKVPSYASMMIASLIYDSTGEHIYLELMEQNIEKSHYDYSYISMLIYSAPCEDIYRALSNIYINCSDNVACGSAIKGILYNKGFIKDINNLEDVLSMKELKRILKNATNIEQKCDLLKKLEAGEFDCYKSK